MTNNKDNKLTVPPWLTTCCADLEAMVEHGRLPQALMIHGQPGTGRRYLALWLAARLLGVPGGRFARLAEGEVGEELEPELGHPDLMVLQPPPEKVVIPVESVRDLVAFMQLRSHQGGARVAMVWPAENMNGAAANSLLKTLEEPPPGGTIIMVAAAPALLPATVISRCHRLRMPLPARETALAWLGTMAETPDWAKLLEFAGDSPLKALALQRSGFSRQMGKYEDDLDQLARRQLSPSAVARKWASGDMELLMRWLYLRAAAAIRQAAATQGKDSLQKSGKPTNIRLWFERLRDAEQLYRNRSRAMAIEIQLAALLQRWYGEAVIGDKH